MRAKKIIPVIMFLISVAALIGYFMNGSYESSYVAKEAEKKGKSLLDLYEENKDITGWIRIPGTKVNYPVMDSDAYLHMDFDKKYAERGTPFLQEGWAPENENALIFGHNMWVERTMFNPLHKYEEKDFWKKHKEAEFFVIQNRGKENAYVEKRTYGISDVCLLSVKSDLYFAADSLSVNSPVTLEDVRKAVGEETDSPADEAESEESPAFAQGPSRQLQEFYHLAEEHHLYSTDASGDSDALTLCTCSYHIHGNRSAGRIFVIGSRIKTEQKDIFEK